MILRVTELGGVFVIELERVEDERGFFARTFSASDFARQGLVPAVAECSIAYNREARTLRGLHFQEPPHEETKLVRCTRGAVYDLVVDLREDSLTHLRWTAIELTEHNRLGLYVPPGCAHGYLTLVGETELLYQIAVPYNAAASSGVRWDDPAVGVTWPAAPRVISARDASFPDIISRRRQ